MAKNGLFNAKMNLNSQINQELEELGSSLAGIYPVNVFRVPSGYFNTVASDVLMAVSPTKEFSTGQVPQGYFDGLASNVLKKIKDLENLDVEEQTLSPELEKLRKVAVFSVSSAYFEELPGLVMSRIKEEEGLPFLSENLASIRHRNLYQVPLGYFDQLAGSIFKQLNANNAQVLKMNSRHLVIRYAAAAVITGILGLAIFSTFNGSKNSRNAYASANESTMKTAQAIIQQGNFDNVLSTLSDRDIVDYLKSTGEDVDAALVASVAASDKLPDQIDYIVDDHTLDKLLDGVIKNNTYSN